MGRAPARPFNSEDAPCKRVSGQSVSSMSVSDITHLSGLEFPCLYLSFVLTRTKSAVSRQPCSSQRFPLVHTKHSTAGGVKYIPGFPTRHTLKILNLVLRADSESGTSDKWSLGLET